MSWIKSPTERLVAWLGNTSFGRSNGVLFGLGAEIAGEMTFAATATGDCGTTLARGTAPAVPAVLGVPLVPLASFGGVFGSIGGVSGGVDPPNPSIAIVYLSYSIRIEIWFI
jgi:hypothetical protein